MGLGDKIKNEAEELKGKAKERLGEERNDEEMLEEGQRDQAEAELKKAGESIKDKAHELKEKMTD